MNPDVITLNNGVTLPRIGYGVFRMTDAEMQHGNQSCYFYISGGRKSHSDTVWSGR